MGGEGATAVGIPMPRLEATRGSGQDADHSSNRDLPPRVSQILSCVSHEGPASFPASLHPGAALPSQALLPSQQQLSASPFLSHTQLASLPTQSPPASHQQRSAPPCPQLAAEPLIDAPPALPKRLERHIIRFSEPQCKADGPRTASPNPPPEQQRSTAPTPPQQQLDSAGDASLTVTKQQSSIPPTLEQRPMDPGESSSLSLSQKPAIPPFFALQQMAGGINGTPLEHPEQLSIFPPTRALQNNTNKTSPAAVDLPQQHSIFPCIPAPQQRTAQTIPNPGKHPQQQSILRSSHFPAPPLPIPCPFPWCPAPSPYTLRPPLVACQQKADRPSAAPVNPPHQWSAAPSLAIKTSDRPCPALLAGAGTEAGHVRSRSIENGSAVTGRQAQDQGMTSSQSGHLKSRMQGQQDGVGAEGPVGSKHTCSGKRNAMDHAIGDCMHKQVKRGSATAGCQLHVADCQIVPEGSQGSAEEVQRTQQDSDAEVTARVLPPALWEAATCAEELRPCAASEAKQQEQRIEELQGRVDSHEAEQAELKQEVQRLQGQVTQLLGTVRLLEDKVAQGEMWQNFVQETARHIFIAS